MANRAGVKKVVKAAGREMFYDIEAVRARVTQWWSDAQQSAKRRTEESKKMLELLKTKAYDWQVNDVPDCRDGTSPAAETLLL